MTTAVIEAGFDAFNTGDVVAMLAPLDADIEHHVNEGGMVGAFDGDRLVRPDGHPLKPATSRRLDAVWRKRGDAPRNGAVAEYAWEDVGAAEETRKPMQVWHRTL